MPKLYPLVGWVQAAGAAPAATPAIDISNLPAGMGGEPAFVDAFLLRLTIPNTSGGGAAAITYQQFPLAIPQISLSSKIYGDLFSSQITGSDVYNWIQPYMGWGPIANHSFWPFPNGTGAAAGLLTKVIDLYLPFRNYRLAEESDGALPTVGFRGDAINMTLGAAAAYGANHALGAVTCTPFAVISTKAEKRAPTVAHWGIETSANATIDMAARAYGGAFLCSNLSGLQGPGAVSAYTNINVARDDQYSGIAMTAENIFQEFVSYGCGTIHPGPLTGATGVAGSLCWPFNPAGAVSVLGPSLDAQTLALPILWERFGQKLSQISMNAERLQIQTAGLAGPHRVLYRAYAPQSQAFIGRMAGLYGMSGAVARPKLVKPPRDAERGVKPSKVKLLPFTLGNS